MNSRFSKKGLMVALSAGAFALAAPLTLAGHVVNINAINNCGNPAVNPVKVSLDAGKWLLTPINPSIDPQASFIAWSAWSHQQAWLNRARFSSGLNGINGTLGGGGTFATPQAAFDASEAVELELTVADTVEFYIADSYCSDNSGGISIKIEKIVCCLDYDLPAPTGWVGYPGLNLLGYNVHQLPLPPWQPVPIDRYLSCYEHRFPDGSSVTVDNCRAAVGKSYQRPPIVKGVDVLSAHLFLDADLGLLKKLDILPWGVKLLATGVELTATKNESGVDLTLTTDAEPDTAALDILRGDKLDNGGTAISTVCSFASGGSPYTCTDAVVGDTYRVLETEYDGDLIVYDEVTPE